MATPQFPVICNVDAQAVREPDEIRQSLQDQVTGTVHWTETIEYLIENQGCELFVEIGPGNVLCGLINRIRKGTPCVAISDSASLTAALPILRDAML